MFKRLKAIICLNWKVRCRKAFLLKNKYETLWQKQIFKNEGSQFESWTKFRGWQLQNRLYLPFSCNNISMYQIDYKHSILIEDITALWKWENSILSWRPILTPEACMIQWVKTHSLDAAHMHMLISVIKEAGVSPLISRKHKYFTVLLIYVRK